MSNIISLQDKLAFNNDINDIDSERRNNQERKRAGRRSRKDQYNDKPYDIEEHLAKRYTPVPNVITFRRSLQPSTRLLYIALLAYDYDDKGYSWKGETEMAAELGLSVSTISDGIAELLALNAITVKPRGDGKPPYIYPRFRVPKKKKKTG